MPTVWRSALPAIDTTPGLAHEEILGRAQRWPEQVAVVDAATGDTLTYGQLATAARRLAGGLRARGAQPGDILALVAGNSPQYAVVLFGVLAAGLTVAPANPLLTARELTGVLGRVRARYVVAGPPAVGAAAEAASRCGAEAVLAIDPAAGAQPVSSLLAGDPLPPQPGDPGATALLFTTSGTGGLPKSAAHTHAAAVAGQRQFDLSMPRLTPDDAVSGAVVFAHIMGTIVLQHTLRSGARFVTLPRFSPEPFLRAVQHHKITVAFGPPPLARLLLSHPQTARSDLSSLRLVVLGAAPVPPAMQQACQARLGCTVAQGFGMSEAWTIAASAYPEQVVHGSVGRLLPGVEAVIVDPASGTRLDAGQPGELWVRGPQLMQGYVGEQEVTAATLDSEGWLHTGDLGYFDTDDNLFITDRVKELIKYKGLQVAPAELEAVLTEHPDVADAAVIPRPHPDAGQVPVAYVVVRHPVQPSDLAEWLAARVAPWKRVWDVVLVDEVPRSPTGKLLRRLLVERDRPLAMVRP